MSATSPPAGSRPILKINVSRSGSFAGDSRPPLPTGTPGTAFSTTSMPTPADGRPKIKLMTKSSVPSTPAAETPTPLSARTKAGRQTKPSKKLVEASKREADFEEIDNYQRPPPPPPLQPPIKKIRIRSGPKSSTPQVVIKTKGKPPYHPAGDGYDSEASDREIDPAIEEQFILRMLPGEHCDYLRRAIEENKFDLKAPPTRPGGDIYMKFFEEDTKRAMIMIKGQPFAAVMLDLPTITEGMKTWDRKSFMKAADISQMLMVFRAVKNEEEARTVALPPPVESAHKWPHGLTPPMHDCVKRRFAKVISRKEIEDKEAEVERLLAADRNAEDTSWEWVDERRQNIQGVYDGDERDADGEEDEDETSYFPAGEQYTTEMDIDDADLEGELEAAFMEGEGDLFEEAPTPNTQAEAPTPAATGAASADTPTATTAGAEGEEDDDDDDDDDEDDDDDDDDQEIDETEQARLDEIQGVRDIIQDLQKNLAQKEAELQRVVQPILRQRLEATIRNLKGEIQLKLSSIGEADD